MLRRSAWFSVEELQLDFGAVIIFWTAVLPLCYRFRGIDLYLVIIQEAMYSSVDVQKGPFFFTTSDDFWSFFNHMWWQNMVLLTNMWLSDAQNYCVYEKMKKSDASCRWKSHPNPLQIWSSFNFHLEKGRKLKRRKLEGQGQSFLRPLLEQTVTDRIVFRIPYFSSKTFAPLSNLLDIFQIDKRVFYRICDFYYKP